MIMASSGVLFAARRCFNQDGISELILVNPETGERYKEREEKLRMSDIRLGDSLRIVSNQSGHTSYLREKSLFDNDVQTEGNVAIVKGIQAELVLIPEMKVFKSKNFGYFRCPVMPQREPGNYCVDISLLELEEPIDLNNDIILNFEVTAAVKLIEVSERLFFESSLSTSSTASNSSTCLQSPPAIVSNNQTSVPSRRSSANSQYIPTVPSSPGLRPDTIPPSSQQETIPHENDIHRGDLQLEPIDRNNDITPDIEVTNAVKTNPSVSQNLQSEFIQYEGLFETAHSGSPTNFNSSKHPSSEQVCLDNNKIPVLPLHPSVDSKHPTPAPAPPSARTTSPPSQQSYIGKHEKKFLFAARKIVQDNTEKLFLVNPKQMEWFYEQEAVLDENDIHLGDFLTADYNGTDLSNYIKRYHPEKLLVTVEQNIAYVNEVEGLLFDIGQTKMFESRLFSQALFQQNQQTPPGEYKMRIRLLPARAIMPDGAVILFEATSPAPV